MSFVGRKLWGERSWKFRGGLALAFTVAAAAPVGYLYAKFNMLHSEKTTREAELVTYADHTGGPLVCFTREAQFAQANFSSPTTIAQPNNAVASNTLRASAPDDNIDAALKAVQSKQEHSNPHVSIPLTVTTNHYWNPLKIWPISPLCVRETEYEIVKISYVDPETHEFTEVKSDDYDQRHLIWQ